MGSYDRADICELGGLFTLSTLENPSGTKIGLFRDDRLACVLDDFALCLAQLTASSSRFSDIEGYNLVKSQLKSYSCYLEFRAEAILKLRVTTVTLACDVSIVRLRCRPSISLLLKKTCYFYPFHRYSMVLRFCLKL